PNPLPPTFMGMPKEAMINACISMVLSNLFSNKAKFLQLLLESQEMQLIRMVNPTAFDNYILHPDFIPQGAKVGAGAGAGDYDDQQYDDSQLGDAQYNNHQMQGLTQAELVEA